LTPTDISTIQPKAWAILSRSFGADRMAGTYLFHGPEGRGRWSLAVALAALLNCSGPIRSREDEHLAFPCGQCRSCRNVFSLNFEGLLFAVPLPPHKNPGEAIDLTNEYIEAKRREPFRIVSSPTGANIPIATAREIKRRLSRKAPEEITRVVLFYRMEKMLAASADALLKLIEEPPEDTVVVLTAERPDSLLPTIQSRSQKIRMERIPGRTIKRYLTERYDLRENRAQLLARVSDGSLGKALEMTGGDEDEDSSRRAVGLLLFRSLLLDDGPQVIAHLTELINAKDRSGAENLLRLWQSLIRDCARYAVVGDDSELTNLDFAPEVKRLSPQFAGINLASRMIEEIKITLADLRLNVHILGALTALTLKLKSNIESDL